MVFRLDTAKRTSKDAKNIQTLSPNHPKSSKIQQEKLTIGTSSPRCLPQKRLGCAWHRGTRMAGCMANGCRAMQLRDFFMAETSRNEQNPPLSHRGLLGTTALVLNDSSTQVSWISKHFRDIYLGAKDVARHRFRAHSR